MEMKRMKSKFVGLACLTMLSVNTYAQENDATDGETHSHEAPTRAGQMIFIDPETGEVVTGQQQVDVSDLKKMQSTSVFGSGVASEPQLLENGTIKIELNRQFMMPVNVSIDEDGNMQKGHHIDVENNSDKENK